jgi:tetratricopeptide (TPR) repeat protein
MKSYAVHGKLLSVLLAITLTCAPLCAFPAPQSRSEALAGLEDPRTEARAEAVVWLANHGSMGDQPLLLRRLRDESSFVRGYAEQGLWLLWSRSGDAEIDLRMAEGIEQMQQGRYPEAVVAFSSVIRRLPAFAEGWNKRATVHFLTGDFKRSLADCGEVVKRNPSHFGALSGYGQIYFQLGQYDKALEYWRRALAVNPNMPGVEMSLRQLEQRLKEKRDRAI